MPLKIIKRKLLPIGVDFGSSQLKMVQFRQEAHELELIAAANTEIPVDCRTDLPSRLEFLRQSIADHLRTGTFQGRRCVLSLPAADTFLGHVKTPRMPDEEVAKILRYEMQSKLPFPAEHALIRHKIAGPIPGDGEDKQEVIVVAVARAALEAYLDMIQRAKLEAVGVSVEACALAECFARLFRRGSDANRTTMFVDLGAVSTQVVLAHGPDMTFARNIGLGEEVVDSAVAANMQVSQLQAHAMRLDLLKSPSPSPAVDEFYHSLSPVIDTMADELTQCIRYFESVFRNQPIERAVFVGGLAHDKRFCQALAQRLNLPATIGDPLVHVRYRAGAGINLPQDRREPQPNWAVAVGLSLGRTRAA